MAHEISHVAARHATGQMTRAQPANFSSIPLIFVGGGIGYAVSSALMEHPRQDEWLEKKNSGSQIR